MSTNNSPIQIDLSGVLLPSGLRRWQADFGRQLNTNAEKAMHKVGAEYRDKIRVDASQHLNIKRQAVLKSFVYKVYNKNKRGIPSLHYYSAIPWMGMHDKGGRVNKKIYIPLTKKKLKQPFKLMKQLMRDLSLARNLFFEKKGKTTIAWAKNTEQFKRRLAPFRAETRARNGRVVKKDERVNVAIVLKSPSTVKRINLSKLAKESIPKVARELERQFNIGRTR